MDADLITAERLNVLLIEDNNADAELLAHYLRKVKNRKIVTETFDLLSSGLNRLAQGGVELVFLDLSLPDATGIDTIVRTRKACPTVAIIILTGNDDDDLAMEALKNGAQDYLVKGQFDSSSLGRAISYALERQRSLAASEWLAAIIDSSPDAIVSKSLDGKILSWNKGAVKIYGYEAAEVLGKSSTMLLPLGYGDATQGNMERLKRGEKVQVFESLRQRKDGTLITVSVALAAMKNQEGIVTGISSIGRDVTDKLISHNALRISEQRLRLAMTASRLGSWFWLPDTNALEWDDRMHEMFGTTRSQFGPALNPTYDEFLKLVHPEDRDLVDQRVKSALRKGTNYYCEYRVLWADGTTHNIEGSGETSFTDFGEPERMAGTCLDITERKRSEEKAREATEQRERIASAIVEYAPVGIARMNAEFVITDVNRAFAALLNWEKNKLISRALADILPSEIFRQTIAAINSDNPLKTFRTELKTGTNGSTMTRNWDMSMWPVAGENGLLEGAVLQIVDCTDSVLLERQREDFIAAIAHDIRNPLMGAERIFSYLCSETTNVSEQTHVKMLDVLRDTNQNLLSMVQNLVDVYRYETLDFPIHCNVTDLSSLAKSCVSQMSFFASSREVILHCRACDSMEIELDEVAIRRVFMNLLHNAVKFSKQGGTVEISLHRADDHVVVEIIDAGDGISDADQKQLFQRYVQGDAGKRLTNGTGLGLYLSRQIVEAHHGTISCKSTLNQGSTFSICLPLTQPPTIQRQAGRNI